MAFGFSVDASACMSLAPIYIFPLVKLGNFVCLEAKKQEVSYVHHRNWFENTGLVVKWNIWGMKLTSNVQYL